MLALISPAKTFITKLPLPTEKFTQPRLLDHSEELIQVARKLSVSEISSLMSVE